MSGVRETQRKSPTCQKKSTSFQWNQEKKVNEDSMGKICKGAAVFYLKMI